jgi:type IV pilus assembly protein PilB
MLQVVSEDFKLQLVKESDKGEEVLSFEKLTDDSSPIIRLIDSTLFDALNKRASDIHIETSQDGVLIKYRVDGVLFRATEPLDARFQGPIISRIKVMSELDIAERRIPQDGRFKVRLGGGKSIDFRVSIMPSIHGEDAVIRILDKESIAKDLHGLTLDVLGIDEQELVRLRRMIREPYGMVLVTGPTGSGKTTTLYAALTEIYNEQDKLITIEDPVEYQLKGVVQIPVNEKKGLTFARGLRSILRHDPDKIMVGEIRDPETAQIAVQSALTGHLVFTTVHANNVFDVLGRFLHMGIDPYNFVSCLNCVAAQRLVRKVCLHCKEPVRYDRAVLADAGLDGARYGDHRFYRGRGCRECNGQGYHGRTAIVELLDLDDDLREMILNKTPVTRLKEAARAAGTRFLRDAAVAKLLAGVTTLEEINRVTFVEPSCQP